MCWYFCLAGLGAIMCVVGLERNHNDNAMRLTDPFINLFLSTSASPAL